MWAHQKKKKKTRKLALKMYTEQKHSLILLRFHWLLNMYYVQQ